MKKIWRYVGLAAVLPLTNGPAWGLGMGDIQMRSYLNEPLRAEIRLLDAAGLTGDDIRVRLATQDDFDRLGVDRAYFLTSLQFSVEADGGDTGKIVLSTETPLLEPYLDFIIETRWPSGRLLREYTVLVDLPAESSAPLVASSQGTVGSQPEASTARSDEPSTSTERRASGAPSASRQRGDTPPSPGGRYLVQTADTLWAIAAAARPSNATVEQTMLATVGLNPDAFAGGNINGLKAGYYIDLPSERDITVSQVDALNAVAQQNGDWQSGIRSAPALRVVADEDLAATEETDAEPGVASVEVDSGATSLAADDPPPAGVGETAADYAAIDAKLGALSQQVTDLQAMITLKDQQIAELQARLAAAEQIADRADAAQQRVESPSMSPAQPDATPATVTAPAPAPAPAVQSDGLTGVPWWQLGLFGALVALVAGWFVYTRRRDASAAAAASDRSGAATTPVMAEQPAAAIAAAPVAAPEPTPAASQNGMEEGGERGYGKRLYNEYAAEDALSDTIAEADIYIAYGRYQQALDLLGTAVKSDPGNANGYLKMLDIYLKTDRLDEANALLPSIRETGDADAVAVAEQKLSAVAEKATAAANLDLGELATPIDRPSVADSSEPVAETTDDTVVGGLGDLSFDLDPVVAEREERESTAANETLALSGIESLDLSLEPELAADTSEGVETSSSDLSTSELTLDLVDNQEDQAVAGDADADLAPELAEVLSQTESLELDVPATDSEEGLVYATEADPMDTKLDLARAYIDMGDDDGARPVLEEVIAGGDLQQQAEARELLLRIE